MNTQQKLIHDLNKNHVWPQQTGFVCHKQVDMNLHINFRIYMCICLVRLSTR